MDSQKHWEHEAENWLRWARAPGFDSYWYYRQTFFDEIVPSPRGYTLEIGCGEGRVARDLAERGHRVIGLDCCSALIQEAAQADTRSSYVRGTACRLPFLDGSVGLVVAYNCLMDVDDMPKVVGGASRVLPQGGRFAICITHPFKDAGTFAGAEPDSPFVVSGSYLESPRRVDQTLLKDGLELRLRGWCHTLEAYSRALEAAGFAIERIREPGAGAEALNRGSGAQQRWARLPLFLMLRAIKG